MRAMLALVLLAALTGCGDLSNEDLRFLAVLPDATLAVEPPADEGQALGAQNELRPLRDAAKLASRINGTVRTVVESLQAVTGHRPTERAAGRRTWGPVRAANGPGWRRLVMEREADGRYVWRVDVAKGSSGPWAPLVTGSVRADDFSESTGAFRFDLATARSHGMTASDNKDPQWVEIGWTRDAARTQVRTRIESGAHGAGEPAGGIDYAYERATDGSGRFEFAMEDDAYKPAREDDLLEQIEWRVRWRPDLAGRADFRLSGGNLQREVAGSVCWDARRARVYGRDDFGIVTPVGSESECAVEREDRPW